MAGAVTTSAWSWVTRVGWADIRANLFELCSGEKTGRTSASEITLFKNVGGGHLDLFTADALIARFQAHA